MVIAVRSVNMDITINALLHLLRKHIDYLPQYFSDSVLSYFYWSKVESVFFALYHSIIIFLTQVSVLSLKHRRSLLLPPGN